MERKPIPPELPITLAILQRLSAVSGDFGLRDNTNFDVAVKLAWARFLQCGEYTVANSQSFNPTIHLTCSSVEFISNIEETTHIHLTLPSSKTDLFRKGVSILVAKAPGSGVSTCAVLALKHLFGNHPQPSGSPLFTDGTGSPLTQNSFNSLLKLLLAAIGLDQSLYSGHSPHQGMASSAAAVGYSDYKIQLLRQWCSNAYKFYIDVPVD